MARDRPREPLAPLGFGRSLPNPALRFGRRAGAGSDPPPNGRSTAPKPAACNAGCLMFGVAPSPAPRARLIPAGRQLRDDDATGASALVECLEAPIPRTSSSPSPRPSLRSSLTLCYNVFHGRGEFPMLPTHRRRRFVAVRKRTTCPRRCPSPGHYATQRATSLKLPSGGVGSAAGVPAPVLRVFRRTG